MAFIDDMRSQGHAVESTCRVLTEHGATLITLDHNVSPAADHNIGNAEGVAFVAFVDSDVTISPSDLRLLAAHSDDSRVAAVAPRIRGATARTVDHRSAGTKGSRRHSTWVRGPCA